MTETRRTGSCLCGGIRFEIEGGLTAVQLCHAARCRKATGAGAAPELAGRADGLRWLAGEDLITHYEAPLLHEPPPYRRAFCRICGSPVPVVESESGITILLAGMLDDDTGLETFRHIFTSQKAGWSQLDPGLREFEKRPPAEARRPTQDDFR
jgi:hypothetical protein